MRAMNFAAASYAFIGVATAVLDKSVVFGPVHFWRIAAWVVSAVVAALHIGYEHFRLRSAPGAAALHVAGGCALGSFGLALAANVNSLGAGKEGQRALLLISLVAWPVLTAVPAFVVSFVAAAVLARVAKR
jgi:hypothetical protein